MREPLALFSHPSHRADPQGVASSTPDHRADRVLLARVPPLAWTLRTRDVAVTDVRPRCHRFNEIQRALTGEE